MREFFWFVTERESIRIKKCALHPWPWTKDPVLQKHYFCNVFREDDRTTRWFRENVREHLWNSDRVLVATVAFRWFNRIETGEKILELLRNGWYRKIAERELRKVQKAGGQLVTGAYMIKSPPGKDKLTGLLDCIDNVQGHSKTLCSLSKKQDWTLQMWHEMLMGFPFLGRFMAYEVVTDLRHTMLAAKATDINTWASAGPGCARGLGWVLRGDPDSYGYSSDRDQKEMVLWMQYLLAESRNSSNWPWQEKPWEMREVEHSLCEYDKWKRGSAGQSLKRLYRPAKRS